VLFKVGRQLGVGEAIAVGLRVISEERLSISVTPNIEKPISRKTFPVETWTASFRTAFFICFAPGNVVHRLLYQGTQTPLLKRRLFTKFADTRQSAVAFLPQCVT
jgi:hypothetical protein